MPSSQGTDIGRRMTCVLQIASMDESESHKNDRRPRLNVDRFQCGQALAVPSKRFRGNERSDSEHDDHQPRRDVCAENRPAPQADGSGGWGGSPARNSGFGRITPLPQVRSGAWRSFVRSSDRDLTRWVRRGAESGHTAWCLGVPIELDIAKEEFGAGVRGRRGSTIVLSYGGVRRLDTCPDVSTCGVGICRCRDDRADRRGFTGRSWREHGNRRHDDCWALWPSNGVNAAISQGAQPCAGELGRVFRISIPSRYLFAKIGESPP
jgi:hypothetical protein